MQSPFKKYKNADLYFPSNETLYSDMVFDEYGNQKNISIQKEIHVEAYLKTINNWSTSEGRLFKASEKQSGERITGGTPENYIALYGYLISPLEIPPELKASTLNGKAKIIMNYNDIQEGMFKLIKLPQLPAVIPYKISRIITRISGIFTWQ